MIKQPRFCEKRNGHVVPFEKKRITMAIFKAFNDSGEGNQWLAQDITETVIDMILKKYKETTPKVEEIQDTVEETLMEHHFLTTARKYIEYRYLHNQKRNIS